MAQILVVDDDVEFRATLRRILEDAGYEVAEAPDGRVAMRMQEETPADLIIIDLLMPGQEGLETIFALRRQQSHVKIIAVSGGGFFGQTQLLDVAKRFGADQVLRKPFSPASLLQLVADLLAAQP